MKNLPIAVRLSLGFGVVLLLVITLGMLSWQSMRDMDTNATAVEKAYMPVVTMSSNASDHVTSLIASAKDFFTYVEEQDRKDTLDMHAKITAEVNETERLVNSHERLKELRPVVATLKKLTADYLAIFNEGAAAILQRQKDLATLTLKSDVVQKNVNELLAQLASQVLDEAQRNSTADIPRVISITRHVTAIGDSVFQVRVLVLRAMTYNNFSHLETMPAQFEKILEQVRAARAEVRNPRSVQLSKEMEEAAVQMQTSVMNFVAQWKKSEELGTRRAAVADQLMQGVRDLSNTGVDATSKVAALLSADTAAGASQSLYITLTAVVLGFIVSLVLTKGITGPVGRCLEFAEAVTKGDLGRVLGMQRRDELGRLATALDAMVGTLNAKISEADDKSQQARVKEQEALEAMGKAEEATRRAESAKREGMLAAAGQLEEIVSIVSSASEQLSAQIEQSERGSTEQAARVTETATAMEEMNSTVLEVARNAGAASDVSTQTRQKAEHGADVVRRTVENIESVQRKSLELKEDMAVLGQHAQSISEIMGVISDIADQTNLLALNAAIEAARAGEAGRGFAVVADEVRKLAEKTMASTTDVGNAIKAIQNSAEKSIRQVEAAVTDIESSTALAVQSGDSLKEIVIMVDNTADQVRAIATASEEQSATSEEINKAMNQINTIATETARAMGEASHAVSELATQSQALARLIEDLKNQ